MNNWEKWDDTDFELKTLIGKMANAGGTAINVMFEIVSHVPADVKSIHSLILTSKMLNVSWIYEQGFVMMTCLNDIPIPLELMMDENMTIGELYEKISGNRKFTEKGMRFYVLPEER